MTSEPDIKSFYFAQRSILLQQKTAQHKRDWSAVDPVLEKEMASKTKIWNSAWDCIFVFQNSPPASFALL